MLGHGHAEENQLFILKAGNSACGSLKIGTAYAHDHAGCLVCLRSANCPGTWLGAAY